MTSQFDPDIAIVAAMEADEQLFTTRVESAPDDEVAIEVDDHDLCGTPPIHPKELSSGSPPQTLPPSAARSLIDVPDDIAQIRGQIFEGKECVAFSAEQWEKYWPFFNNMYTKSGKPRVGKDGITKQYLACRLFASKTKVAKATTGERNKRARNPIACPKTARKITLPDGQVRFEPVDPTISHNHDLDTIDSISRPQIFKTAAGQEIAKGYAPAAVLSSICGHGGQQEGIQASIAMAGGTWLSRQDVLNAGRHCRKANPDSRQVGHDFLPTTQVEEVQQFLSAKSATGQLWLHKALKATRSLDGEDSPGVIFTSAEQLAALQRRGHITLLDATHNTNWLGWLLYTVMARDECGSWLPVGHFLTAKSDGDVVAAALKQLRLWIAQHCGQEWMLRYFLTDDSAVEQRAVKIAFDGSGQSVEHLLCSVHCERTLRRRFQGPRNRVVLDHMLAALKNRRTRVGCQASLDSAIAAVASQADAQYIVDHWQNRMEMWAHFARDHSPLLMQIGSTNAIKGYHSALKYNNKSILQRFSLLGIVKHIITVDRQFFERAAKNKKDFRGKSLREAALYPGVGRFPVPVQILLAVEIRAGQTLANDGELVRPGLLEGITVDTEGDEGGFQWESAHCDCRWYRRWFLPCSHLWHHHFVNDNLTLTESRLRQWSLQWDEHGYELYEAGVSYHALPASTEAEAISATHRIEAREVAETLMTSFYELERAAHKALGAIKGRDFVAWWIKKLRESAAGLSAITFESWKAQ